MGGEITWEDRASDFDWETTTAVPAVLRQVFQSEPKWGDLRGLARAEIFLLLDEQDRALAPTAEAHIFDLATGRQVLVRDGLGSQVTEAAIWPGAASQCWALQTGPCTPGTLRGTRAVSCPDTAKSGGYTTWPSPTAAIGCWLELPASGHREGNQAPRNTSVTPPSADIDGRWRDEPLHAVET